MTVKTRIDPLGLDLALFFAPTVTGPLRSKMIAQFAGEQRDQAQTANARALGRFPVQRTFVDGRQGAALESVKADGAILFEFDLISDAVAWIIAALRKASPVRSGKYQHSHRLFVNGSEFDDLPVGFDISEVVFIPLVPYARPIERGESKQAPDGVYRGVAALARARFGRFAKVTFTWREIEGVKGSQPAIVLTVK